MIQNECSIGYDHIPASLTKPVLQLLILTNDFDNKQFLQNELISRHMGTH